MKQLFSSVLILILPLTMEAQGLFFRIGGGYGIPMASATLGDQYVHTYTYNPNGNIDTYSTKSVSGSFGSGMNLNLAGGYRFNGNYAVEVQVQYLLGRKFETSQKYYNIQDTWRGSEEDVIKHYSRGWPSPTQPPLICQFFEKISS